MACNSLLPHEHNKIIQNKFPMRKPYELPDWIKTRHIYISQTAQFSEACPVKPAVPSQRAGVP